VSGLREMARARDLDDVEFDSPRELRKLASGPGRLCEALGITRPRDNGKDMVAERTDLRVMDDAFKVREIGVTPRIGITKSAELPLRYTVANSPYLSRR